MKNVVSRKILPLTLLFITTLGYAEEAAAPEAMEMKAEWHNIHKALLSRADDWLISEVEEYEANVNQEAQDGIRPLHLAARFCRPAAMNYLLKKGANVTATSSDGLTVLHHLVYANQCSDAEKMLMIDILMKSQAIIDAKSPEGYTPLFYALDQQNDLLTRAFLSYDADARVLLGSTTLFHYAVNNGYVNFVKIALEMRPDLINEINPVGETPLIVAVMGDQPEMVDLLLKAKATIDMPDQYGETALHIAAQLNRSDMMKSMLAHESSVDAAGIYKFTPMHYAAYYNLVDIIKELVEHKACLEMRDEMGRTPLHIAVLYGSLDAAQTLLDLGALTNAEDNAGNTALELLAATLGKTSERSTSDRIKYRKLMHELSLSRDVNGDMNKEVMEDEKLREDISSL